MDRQLCPVDAPSQSTSLAREAPSLSLPLSLSPSLSLEEICALEQLIVVNIFFED